MRLRLRLLRIILAALCRRKNLYLDGESVLYFTVMPSDCVFCLVGNDRYHSFMDLGRIDLLIRLGGWQTLWYEDMQPFVFTVHVNYCLPLKMFQRFELHTTLSHWNNTSFWMEHVFKSGRKTIATAISKCGFTHQNKVVPTELVFNVLSSEKITSIYPKRKITTVASMGKLLREIKARQQPGPVEKRKGGPAIEYP